MKKFLLFIFILSAFGKTRAQQNLLPDGGFEILKDSCQNYGLGDMNAFQYWWVGNTGSTDPYFCCTYPNGGYMCGYPGGAGVQYPRTGNDFAGIYFGGFATQNLNYREYLQSNLLQPLTAGKKYYGGFYVNLAENFKRYSVNNIGMLLTDTIAPATSIGNVGDNGVIYGNPQIMNDTNRILADTTGWILVADTFVAQGGEKYLTIGDFRDDAHTIYVPTGYNCFAYDSNSYYFIDDVFLYCVDTACPPFNPTAIHELHQQKTFDVYPNPSNGNFKIKNNFSENYEIEIFNSFGQEVFRREKENENSFEVDLSDKASGIYFVRIKSENEIFTQKIIKE